MSTHQYTYKQEIYLQFKELDRSSLRNIVQYVEKNRDTIEDLDSEEFFEVYATYCRALFDLGNYSKYIIESEQLLFLSIDQNIFEFEGEDIYASTLFRKAAGLFNLGNHSEAKQILIQLLKIDPENKDVKAFYKKVIRSRYKLSKITRAIAVGMILASAFMICLELLVIRPFYQHLIFSFELSRNLLFASGFLIFLFGDFLHFLIAEIQAMNEIKSILINKKKR
jgi:tetratricopeptide (TPR) repeat protein